MSVVGSLPPRKMESCCVYRSSRSCDEFVYRVPGEAGEGFGEDQVDPPPLVGGDHAVELCALFQAGAGDAPVRKNSGHLPIGVFGVNADLKL